MADLHIRRLTDADVAPAAAILSAAFGPSPWDVSVRRHLALQPEGLLLAEQGGRPVGVVSGVDYGPFAGELRRGAGRSALYGQVSFALG